MIDERRNLNVAISRQDAIGVAGQLARTLGQVAELNMEHVFGRQVLKVCNFAWADVPMKGIQANSQMRAANLTHQRGSGFQVVAKATARLEFECGSQAAFASFLRYLHERHL